MTRNPLHDAFDAVRGALDGNPLSVADLERLRDTLGHVIALVDQLPRCYFCALEKRSSVATLLCDQGDHDADLCDECLCREDAARERAYAAPLRALLGIVPPPLRPSGLTCCATPAARCATAPA